MHATPIEMICSVWSANLIHCENNIALVSRCSASDFRSVIRRLPYRKWISLFFWPSPRILIHVCVID